MLRFLFLFNQERIIALSPKAIQEILVTNSYLFQKPQSARRVLSSVIGEGLVVAEGATHRLQRRNMMPAFGFRHIKDLYPVFWGKARDGLLAMERSVAESGEISVSSWASRITLDIIGIAAMGSDFDAIQNPDSELVAKYTEVFDTQQSITRVLMVLSSVFPRRVVECLPVARVRRFLDAVRVIRRRCRGIVKEKRAKMQSGKLTSDVDILSVAMQSGLFSDDDLEDQLMTFFAAGHETTSATMTWAMYALCRNPEMQRKLRAEVRTNLPSADDAAATISSADIDRLPYLNAVVNETLRLYPVVPMTVREAVQDLVIQGVPIPRGTIITIPPWAVNVDKTLWGDDADEFKPERWIDRREVDGVMTETANNTGGSTSNYAFLTFLHGPRSCIGSSFAKAEFACMLATWVRRFEFELADPVLMDQSKLDISKGVTVKPKDGLKVIAKVVPDS